MSQPCNELARQEWDFEHFFFEKKDVSRIYHCFTYEYARSVPSVVAAFQEDRVEADATWRRYLIKPQPWQISPIDCFPYMDFSYHDLGWCAPEDTPNYEFDTVVAPPGFPDTPFLLLKSGSDENGWAFEIPNQKAVTSVYLDGKTWVEKRRRRRALPDEVFHLRIRWEHSNDVILKHFKEWLESLKRPRKAVVIRGKGGTKKILGDLKALGALRLHNCFEGDIAAAEEFCHKETGRRLYQQDKNWTKPIRRAQSIIDDWSRREIFGG